MRMRLYPPFSLTVHARDTPRGLRLQIGFKKRTSAAQYTLYPYRRTVYGYVGITKAHKTPRVAKPLLSSLLSQRT